MAKSKRKSKRPQSDRPKAKRVTANSRAAARTKSSQSELQKIERLLGEDFETLAEARRALAKDTGAARGKKSYTVAELSTKKHRTISTFIRDLEEHADEVDELKPQQDFWAAEVYGNKTYMLYSSAEELAKKLGTYKGLQEEHPRKALKNVNVIRVKGMNASKYLKDKIRATEQRWKERKEKHKLDRKRQRVEARKLKDSQRMRKEQAKVIQKLRRKLRGKK